MAVTDHAHALEPLFNPESVAIVGASPRSGYSRALADNLARYRGPVALVNPKHRDIEGRPCAPSLLELAQPAEHVLCIAPAASVPQVLADAVATGSKAITLYAASGLGRLTLEDCDEVVVQAVREGTLLICGPNCMGAISTTSMMVGYTLPILAELASGRISTISHSGGSLGPWIRAMRARGLGTRYAVSSGDELGVSTAQYLEMFVDDPGTGAIVLQYLESPGDGDRFARAAEAALLTGKPILAVCTGRTPIGRQGIQTHTGKLAPPARDLEAAANSTGISTFSSMDDLLEALVAFGNRRRPAGNRVAVHAISGAVGNHVADLVGELGPDLRLSEFSTTTHHTVTAMIGAWAQVKNPVDSSWAGASSASTYYDISAALAADENTDAVLLEGELPRAGGGQPYRFDPDRLRRLREDSAVPVYLFSRLPYTPDLATQDEIAAEEIPFLQGAGRAVAAVNAVTRWAQTRRRHLLDASEPTGSPPLPFPAGEGVIRHDELAPVLAAYGIDVARGTHLTMTEDQVADPGLGWPLALKRLDIVHKTDEEAVALNIGDAQALHAAAHRLRSIGSPAADPVLYAQEMVGGVWEMFLGGHSSVFGPVLVAGLGGIWSEVVADTVVRLAPVSETEAEQMLFELKAWPALSSNRQRLQADIAWLTRTISAFSTALVDACGQGIEALEANPLMVRPAGAGGSLVDLRATRNTATSGGRRC